MNSLQLVFLCYARRCCHHQISNEVRTFVLTRLFIFLIFASAVLHIGCERVPPLVDYQKGSMGVGLETAPVIIVGQILNNRYVGRPHPSHWYPDDPMQLGRVTVRLENVLRGHIGEAEVPIYYLIGTRQMGHTRMGMVGRGGHWQIGDRAIFFLHWDSGVLRTVWDTWAYAAVPVLTGSHPSYKPRPGEPISKSVIDILLDSGQECDSAQWANAILVSTSKASTFDLAYTVRKLHQIAETYMPEARPAALGELDELSYSWPKIRDGWPGPDKNTNK
jgi:hypothetical protein